MNWKLVLADLIWTLTFVCCGIGIGYVIGVTR